MTRSLLGNKHVVLFLALLALGALTVLATSLEEVPFRDAQRFALEEAEESEPAPALAQDWQQAPVDDNFLVLLLVLLVAGLIVIVLSPDMRKQMLKILPRVAFAVATVLFLIHNYGDRLFAPEPEPVGGGSPAAGANISTPVFEPPEVASSFSYLVIFGVALFWLVLIWMGYRAWKKYSLQKSYAPLEEFARIARSSLEELSAGQNSSDVIINCYLRMSDVVSDRRRLERAPAMTPHEFAVRLEQAGLPGDAVKRLTRLFEAVRYGDRKSGPKDINEAVSCLNTILHYCGEPV
ncbi:MAG TPA: DUF4129 domain-containing protein [Anaerolineales bacterium]|nr:DUF4129 domain-containing protein [Anaerolineales bacterium]